MNQKVTIKTVAEKCGVSTSIVSRVLNGKEKEFRINENTAKKVREIAKELNYTPSQTARGFRLKKTFTLGLVLPSIKNPFFAELCSILMEEAGKRGYFILFADSGEDPKQEKEVVCILRDRGVDGLFILPSGKSVEYLEDLYKGGFPIVFIDRHIHESPIPFVGANNYQGAVDATKYLLKKGHTKIACIQGTRHAMSNQNRLKGFTDTIHKITGAKQWLVGSSFTEQNGYIQTLRLLKEESKPTAIFAMNNLIAFGVMRALRELNLKIPEDISLISFDDQELLRYVSPPVTAVSQPKNAIIEMALNVMMALMEQKRIAQNHLEFPVELITRASVKNG